MNEYSQPRSGISALIRDRRTIRSFTSDPLDRAEVLSQLYAAASAVATDWTQPDARYIFVGSDDGKRRAAAIIMEAYREQGLYRFLPDKLNRVMQERLARIPAYLIVQLRTGAAAERDLASVYAALHRFTLLAWSRDIGLVWNTEPILHKPCIAQGFGLGNDQRIVCILYLGRFAKAPKAKRRTPAQDKLTLLR
ncbi:nitroreductase family protein [Paenibacillus sp. IB182496]|uniref:Nitroreductase family protein n=1 Tax=Paenibacillus sabuli TaxID=2772509 RepID=A0A927GTE7_9BACL|nr:nitroreductase family protein [Paenibacillus sabuli]MBD2847020.1 nitroreductase family protein [Paenibacillus sabuli]